MFVTLIADDLTGACDAGAMFAGRDRVRVFVGESDANFESSIAVVDTESRHLAPAAAAARVGAAAKRLSERLAAGVLFKKIDSTLRGPVGAEIDALLDATGRRRMLVCPAFPEQARTVRNGILCVNGAPAHRSSLGGDPGRGIAGSTVGDIIARDCARPISVLHLDQVRGARRALHRALEETDGVAVADAETDADLDALAQAALTHPGLAIAGSAGLARAVAASLGLTAPRVAVPAGSAWLIVVGSAHPVARAQLSALEEAGVVGARLGGSDDVDADILLAALDEQRPVFVATGDDVTRGLSGEAASRLASLAARILAASKPDAIAVTGGDTAAALLGALGARSLELLGAPGSGLALGEISVGGSSALPLLTKAGGFGARDAWVNLLKGRTP
jgi:uncharacterized protein YgbK (DUF1537 family)